MNKCVRIIPRTLRGSIFKMRRTLLRRNILLNYSSDKGRSEGAIREAGGAFGKRGEAKEDEYFYRQQKEQIAKLKTSLSDEISFHEEQIQRHKEAIERNKKRVEELSKGN